MTFRSRLLLACVPLTVAPVALVAFGVRSEVNERVRAQYDARVDAMARVVEEDLERESRAITERLASLSALLADDNRLRLQLLGADAGDRRYLLDYAGRAMRLAGLDVLQLQDEGGRILSSGHFRNDFDRGDPAIVEALRAAGGRAIAEMRTADRTFPALLHVADIRIGARTFTLVGGTALDRGFLSSLDPGPRATNVAWGDGRGAGLSVVLDYPRSGESLRPARRDRESNGITREGDGRTDASRVVTPRAPARRGLDGGGNTATALVRTIELPFVTGAASSSTREIAALVITQSLEPLHELQTRIDRWFIIVTASAAIVALVLASWAAARLSRPLAELAQRTRRLDLDRLDVDFRNDRRDEVGTLARTLDALTDRLRTSVTRLRDAERRAAFADIARQVNHDVRNGLTPIRNVVRHLAEVARTSPADLPGVFRDRQQTIDASVDYLHSLAGNYARLSPRSERRACDIAATLRELRNGLPEADRSRVYTAVAPGLPSVYADPIALRRVLENIVNNALESLEPSGGRVTVSVDAAPSSQAQLAIRNRKRETQSPAGRRLRIVVADDGHGMTPDQVSKIFNDFYTTKDRGTGLGLSIVRRLVNDLRGSITVDSEAGKGTRFTIELPADGARPEPIEAFPPEAQRATRNAQLDTAPPRRAPAES